MEEYVSVRKIRKAFVREEVLYSNMYNKPKSHHEKKVAMIALGLLKKIKREVLPPTDEKSLW